MKDEGRLVIWPASIDRSKSRNEGRIISRKSSVKEPSLEEMEKAAASLDLNPEVQKDKAYPRSWWEKSGRILVDKNEPRTTTARQISKTIKKDRQG
ncbi:MULTISPECIES: signal recognition particle protein Srp19 [Methanohalophilus]|uniref:Signal recognition particle 19 kDa protein n=1 Tax=Methanohalophilus euhalobius TaxID=51203 RepID=A0A285G965_9EURY|nr:MULTISPECIES: signal recognition particle protein Srp19 [Methanohalophilus]KXS45860.1 MAG: signal recognition particle subunit SRP19 [Methanohalophilus sp. T328-1]RSD36162.1 MAG: signal recognition particle subunit SRP19 [Methanohalophilus sp.]OBZ35957.1 MAG: signal recognition particle protein Srp19 [Methanohalophilus sp. DAL1]ODV50412.1 MAG: signal recognition particle subunit SRP19 [Methanohalophilus sp. 2-GBenrich]PQV42188.1 signal recognition particle subunit SRP19 (srp19) [Methanohalo